MLKKDVFYITFISVLSLVGLGLFKNEQLTEIAKSAFSFSLVQFGWLYQLVAMGCFFLLLTLLFTKFGNIRFGGENAKAKFSFLSWFALTLTSGIASGLITYGANEPVIYYGNVYGELDATGIVPQTDEAFLFSIARCFYNWSFVAYTFYTVSGIIIAYMHFNCKKKLSVSACVSPILGENKPKVLDSAIDILVLLAVILGISSSLGAGLTLIGSGIEVGYGIKASVPVWLIITVIMALLFIFAAVSGLHKGIKLLADSNMWVFYGLLILLFIIGPTVMILEAGLASVGVWLDHFFRWGFDSGIRDGQPLVTWWTMYDWAIWIAFAPLMGMFLARIAYGRTIREFLIVNWILPSVFAIIWFSVWGVTALEWQQSGKVDLVAIIKSSGAVAGLWGLLKELPLGIILIPVVIVTLVISFSTTADAVIETISGLCVKAKKDEEQLEVTPPNYLKVIWGVLIGGLAFFMVAKAGGTQGIDGVKYLAAAGGFTVLFVFLLQLMSLIKVLLSKSSTD